MSEERTSQSIQDLQKAHSGFPMATLIRGSLLDEYEPSALMDDWELWRLISSENTFDALPFDGLASFQGSQDPHPIQVNGDDKKRTRLRKHRESMSRLRQERRERIQQLDHQEQRLHEKLQKLLRMTAQHRGAHELVGCEVLTYADLVGQSEALRAEGYALEQELHRHQLYRKLVASDLVHLEASQQNHKDSMEEHWLLEQRLVYYEPVTRAACSDAIKKGLTKAALMRKLLRDSSTAQVSNCIGWKVERQFTNSAELHFRCSRRFSSHTVSVQGLLNETWVMLRSPEKLQTFFGRKLKASLVQRVSDDADVCLCCSAYGDGREDAQFFMLITRLQAVGGQSAAILMLILDKQPQPALLEELQGEDQDRAVWLGDGGAQLQFTRDEEGEIQVECVGTVPCRGEAHALRLIVDACARLVRWGQELLPIQLLFAQDYDH